MNQLFVRLALSGAVAGLLSTSALADNASIALTGPGSTNTVTSIGLNSFRSKINNWADLGNWNNQVAKSGDVWVTGNTGVYGGGTGSGNAYNYNNNDNNVTIANTQPYQPYGDSYGNGSNGNGVIYLTGPYSANSIGSYGYNRYNADTNNYVNANNVNNQNARSGAVNITGNTLVEGVGGSGDAVNNNNNTNTLTLTNGNSLPALPALPNGGDNGVISTTGPGSYNAISSLYGANYNQRTNNYINSTNSNQQTARSGDVNVTGNTVVLGIGGSGNAYNSNSNTNGANISNN